MPPIGPIPASGSGQPAVRGDLVWRGLDSLFTRLNAALGTVMPRPMNPFVQTGAVANTTFIAALVSGVLLLFWYDPSVHAAYESVERMQGPAALLRSLHRYSSDACMLFALLHGLQVLASRKFTGPRWLAWLSGLGLVGFLWLDGWTGYWLVWDERAREVALETARVVDLLPIFPEPLLRSFLTDESINSLLFFIVFFIHMMIPLGMGILLWIHIMRLNKAKFLTGTKMSVVLVAVLLILSALLPVTSEGAAHMTHFSDDVTIDWYYLLPVVLSNHLHGGMLTVLAIVFGCFVAGMPWILSKGHVQPAVVDVAKCNGCTLCYQDCPYNAITMIPGANGGEVASIEPALCTGCGLCVGSCDPAGIAHALSPHDVRRWVNQHADNALIAFVCTECSNNRYDGQTHGLAGYRVLSVPCIGWVHMLLVERALRRGARGVLLAGCNAAPACRLGADFTHDRLIGDREPRLRSDRVSPDHIRYVKVDRTNPRKLEADAKAFRREVEGYPQEERRRRPARLKKIAVLSLILGAISLLTVIPGAAPLPASDRTRAELVVSFKHPGQSVERSAPEDEKDQEDLLPHMRRYSSGERVRVPVRLRVIVDGEVVHDRAYEPAGVFSDGASIAIASIPVEPGEHHVRVEVGNSPQPDEWAYVDERLVELVSSRQTVVLFDRVSGFSWH